MSNLTRRERESRAYALTLSTGGFGVASVALLVLSIVGVGSFGLFLLAAILTAGSFVMLRRTLHR